MSTPQDSQATSPRHTLDVHDQVPAALGFRMPAEWEPHRATWLVWPHSWHDWETKLPAIHWCYVEIVSRLISGEKVAILVKDAAHEARARRKLEQAMVDLSRVEFYTIRTNRSWIRDHGPLFIVRSNGQAASTEERKEIAVTDWRFNSWARYSNWKLDNEVAGRLADVLGVKRIRPHAQPKGTRRHLVLEGGSVDTNGRGLLLTTEECLLSSTQARNPGLSREQMEELLGSYLGARKVLWLNRGIAGDDTHGHVDDVARFVAPRTVVAAIEDNPRDENYLPLKENRERLEGMTDLDGHRLDVVPIPMPRPLVFEGQRLPASYLNFYISNSRVLVPTFNDPADRVALGRLAGLFPDRETVGIHAVDLVLGLGTIHCLTLQEPT